MDSDTDSESELPPGWEKTINNEEIIYINHFSNTSQSISPLKDLRIDNGMRFDKNLHYNRSCGFHRKKQKSDDFIQKFDSFSTSEQVMMDADLSMKNALIIGGCSGIGLEIVHHLTSKNCKLILGCPDLNKCSLELKQKLGEEVFTEFLTIFHLDLKSFKSIDLFCKSVLQTYSEISIIIFCAAVMNPPYIVTEDGFESSFQINILSQFYIQEILLPKFVNIQNNSCRIVWLSCESHRAIKEFNLNQLNPSALDYNGFYSYAFINLCKIIIVKHSKVKWDSMEYPAAKPLFYACHPGNVISGTKITRFQPYLKILFWVLSPFTKTLSQASATPLFCCISSHMKKFSGCYFNNGCICEPSILGQNAKHGELLWEHLIHIIHLKSLSELSKI